MALRFKPIEFDGIKIRIMQLLPKTYKFNKGVVKSRFDPNHDPNHLLQAMKGLKSVLLKISC